MEGFIIEAEEEGLFLTKELYWYEYLKVENAFVHHKSILERLQRETRKWGLKPKWVYPATYDGIQVVNIGERFPLKF